MLLFVGLGNPGAKYARNRHNVGFMALDQIAADHGFPAFRAKFQGELSEGRFGSTRVALLKPATFMNRSGQSVAEAMRFHKLPLENVTIFHDELDVAFGRVKVKTGGGLSRNLAGDVHFPRLALQMISVGEETGQLDTMLLKVADTYDREVRNTIDRLLSVFTPLVTLLMAVMISSSLFL